ncbi:MAG: M23 family metallopeptidase, partial [Eubacteriales bacterium]|nr:M23 family metallopeptidase [Eubacteriales bacterium]MDD3289657.1 M23 family metallopeptidase [Eubacteriales bacterium]MDD3863651.1 M23 family metallopeptidase [Eubacteriales bacterium]
ISQATTDATMNNPEGPSNWANRIKVLWETYDVEKYWTETFLQPCEGPISTEFGLYRYTNDNPVPARHSGIDIAVPTGTPVLASNSGRVVRAESIIYTGNTVVIEHGGGLKTYYYHMNSLDVKEGQHVERGTLIGKVGSTGYSTGAHLHFEVKMGRSSLSPWELFDGSSEVYFTGDFLK